MRLRRVPYARLASLALLGAGAFVLAACQDGVILPPELDDPPVTPAAPPLKPGHYDNPLVLLQRLQGTVGDHLHVDEVRYKGEGYNQLLQCSYTFGVIDAHDPKNMKYLSDGLTHVIPNDTRAPGCIHLAWDGVYVYTTHRGNIDNPTFLTTWDIADPKKPVQLPVLQEPGVSYEGIDVANHTIFVGLHANGLGVYKRDAVTNTFTRIGTATGFKNAWGVHAVDKTVFVTDATDGLGIVDATDPTAPKLVGKVATGGDARGVVVNGTTAYVAAGSAGVIVVDVSNLSAPKVIGKAEIPGGTALRVDYSAGKLFVAAWNDARVFDVSTPASPRLIGAVRIAGPISTEPDDSPNVTWRTLGIAGLNDVMFVGNWHLIHSYRVYADRLAPHLVLPEGIDPFDLGQASVGASTTSTLQVSNQGTAPLVMTDGWADGASFTVDPKQLKLKPGDKADLSITFKAAKKEEEISYLHLASDDPAQPSRSAFLCGNLPGIGLGTDLPETTVSLVDGGQWSSPTYKGNVMMLAYFATF
jgi:LVIVD repeat